MLTEEEKAALKRLQRLQKGESLESVYLSHLTAEDHVRWTRDAEDPYAMSLRSIDRGKIADAMLRLFPADDDDPITEEWAKDHWPKTLSARGITLNNHFDGENWTIDLCVEAEEITGDGKTIWIANAVTRGDVRAFLRGMNFPLAARKQS